MWSKKGKEEEKKEEVKGAPVEVPPAEEAPAEQSEAEGEILYWVISHLDLINVLLSVSRQVIYGDEDRPSGRE